MEVEHEYNLLDTNRDTALEIIQFLVSYHAIKLDEVDFSE